MNQGHVRRRCPKPIEGKCATNRCGHAYEWRFSHAGHIWTGKGAGFRAARAAMTKAMARAESGELPETRARKRAAEEAARVEAERMARELEARVRLGDYLDQWLERRGNAIKPATRRGYADIITNHVRPRLGEVPLEDLTKADVRRLLENLAQPDAKGKLRTSATLARIRSLLSGALEQAVDDELLERNVARGVKLPETTGKGRDAQGVFTPAQLTEFLRRADLTPYGRALRFIATTGVRRGEAVGLRWVDVDLDAGVATIQRSLSKVRSEFILDTTKTENVRRVPLVGDVLPMLRELRRSQAEDAMSWGRAAWNPDGYVFVRVDGTHLRPDSLTQATADITTAMGLPHLHVHSLRHSMGSAALDAGVDVKVVADLLGHKTTATTQNFYQHTSDDAARRAAESIAAWRAGSVATPVANPAGAS
jgi:integrase